MKEEHREAEEAQFIKRLFYDGSFKFISGLIGILLVVLWWGITHQLSTLETQIRDLQATTQQVRADLSQNYANQLQARVQIDTNSKRIDKLEAIVTLVQERTSRTEAIDGYKNGRNK